MRLLVIILFAACGSRDAETPSNTESSSNTESPSNEPASPTRTPGEATANTPAEAPIDPRPAPVIDLRSIEDEGRSLQVRVVGSDAVELRRSVRIERRSAETWELVDAGYSLRVDCEETTGECLTLAVGAELSAPGVGSDSGQCGGSELAPGTYRFVVQSCAAEGTRPHEIHSVFTLNP